MTFWLSRNKTVNNLDNVPQPLRTLYQETDDGRYEFNNTTDDLTLGTLIASVLSLEQTVVNERTNTKRPPSIDLTPLEEYGSTVEEIQSSISTLKSQLADKNNIDPKKIRDEIQSEFIRKHQLDLDKEKSTNSALSSQLDMLIVDQHIARTVEKYAPGRLELWSPILKQHVRTQTDDTGVRHAYVVDSSGDRRFSAATASDMSIEELMIEFKGNPSYSPLFPSESPSGGGASPTARRTTNGIAPAPRRLSPVEKITAGLNERNIA
jgi:hypothetical protein